MTPFLQQLIEDLKDFSSELLTPGLNSSQQVVSGMVTVSNTTALLNAIDFLTALVPLLVAELQTSDSTNKLVMHYTPSPKRAVMSHRPSDYQYDSRKRLLPARWITGIPADELDIRPLRWLLFLLELQQDALEEIQARTNKYIDNSLLTQKGDSSYAQNDRATLLSMRLRLSEAQANLEHARTTLLRLVQQRFVPSATVPYPYPRSPAWTRLRMYAQQLIHPTDYLPGYLQNLLQGTVEIADTPYLYQRWCGVKLLRGFEQIGWISYDDPVGALFLGGEIQLHKKGLHISLWVEPRFVKRRAHPSGFNCKSAVETHPDYMIVTPGANGGVDAFILDPTTTIDVEIRRTKSRYIDMIEAVGMTTLAGIPVVRNPLRAWSAAPLHKSHCELDDVEGRTGTIPMHPLDWYEQPLLEWLRDIDGYALAWGKYAETHVY